MVTWQDFSAIVSDYSEDLKIAEDLVKRDFDQQLDIELGKLETEITAFKQELINNRYKDSGLVGKTIRRMRLKNLDSVFTRAIYMSELEYVTEINDNFPLLKKSVVDGADLNNLKLRIFSGEDHILKSQLRNARYKEFSAADEGKKLLHRNLANRVNATLNNKPLTVNKDDLEYTITYNSENGKVEAHIHGQSSLLKLQQIFPDYSVSIHEYKLGPQSVKHISEDPFCEYNPESLKKEAMKAERHKIPEALDIEAAEWGSLKKDAIEEFSNTRLDLRILMIAENWAYEKLLEKSAPSYEFAIRSPHEAEYFAKFKLSVDGDIVTIDGDLNVHPTKIHNLDKFLT